MMNLSVSSRFGLVGPGAIGLYYGGLLAQAGVGLHVLARSDFEVLEASGICMRMLDPQTDTLMCEAVVKPEQVAQTAGEIGLMDCVVIAAKSTVNGDLVESLKSLVEPGRTVILTLQNGMGNSEFFAEHFPDNPILVGLCFVCVNRTGAGVVENYLPGRVEFGSLEDRWPELVESVARLFELGGSRATVSENLDAALWRKLCWNVPFNGLAIAEGGLTTDLILADRGLRMRARLLMEEVRAAAAKAGHRISDRFIEGQFEVTETMGAYRPSSLIDFLDGRPVEVDAIWGEPLRRGEVLNVEMPELRKLLATLDELLLGR